MHTLAALALYLLAIADDGDWHNDWATHLPHRGLLRAIGRLLAGALGPLGVAWRGLGACADPTMPAHASHALAPLYRTLAALYDALITLGVC